VSETESIDAETALSERILLGLRLAEGIDIEAAASHLEVDPWPPQRRKAVERLLAEGRLLQNGPRLTIPNSEWLLADAIIAEVM
jgi:oxygen-independent coproporphyrinogen-3 oxidase